MGKRRYNIDHCLLPTAKLAYKVLGDNAGINIVIEAQLASCSAEWWHIAEKLSERYRVLVYDRAGYGKSSSSRLARTPENIAVELNGLLQKLDFSKNLILIGHSQGGLYVQQYVRLFSDNVKGIVLIDPLSADDRRFKDDLSEREYAGAYIDKSKNLKIAYNLSRFRIISLLKSKLLLSPPFYYFKDFTEEATDYMLDSFVSAKHYKTALEEYTLSHMEAHIVGLRSKGEFPDIPLLLLYHTPEVMIEEIMKFGGLTREEAVRVDKLWEGIIKGYLNFSDKSRFIIAKNSSHSGIHLTEEELVFNAVDEVAGIKK